MCASSCARIASSCCGDSPASALAGRSTTGLSHPITVGTSTSRRFEEPDVRAMCSRRDRRATMCCQPSAAGDAPCDFIRCTHSQPLTSRSVSTPTPQQPAEHQHRQPALEPRRVERGRPVGDRASIVRDDRVQCRSALSTAAAGAGVRSGIAAAAAPRRKRRVGRARAPQLHGGDGRQRQPSATARSCRRRSGRRRRCGGAPPARAR